MVFRALLIWGHSCPALHTLYSFSELIMLAYKNKDMKPSISKFCIVTVHILFVSNSDQVRGGSQSFRANPMLAWCINETRSSLGSM